jgi:site-specific recombinase XerC
VSPQRPHRPHEEGPRLEQRGRWFAADLRPWGGPRRQTLRNPKAPGWPRTGRGERTEDPETADRWRWAYVDVLRGDRKRLALDLGAKPTAVETLVGEYLAHRERQGATVSSLKGMRTALLVHLAVALDRATTSDAVTTDRLQRFLNGLADDGYAPSTLATLKKTWRAFFAWVAAKEKHEHNPVVGITTPEPMGDDADVYTFDEAGRGALRDAADRIDREGWPAAVVAAFRATRATREGVALAPTFSMRRALELGLGTGGRQGELFGLTEGAFRHRAVRFTAQLNIRGELAPLKGKHARTALVLPDWWAWHRQGAPGGDRVLRTGRRDAAVLRISGRWIWLLYRTAERLHGLAPVPDGIGWHALRHTYARVFIESGGRMEELRKSLGHSSIVTTETFYDHFHEDHAAALAAARIYPPDVTPLRPRGVHAG